MGIILKQNEMNEIEKGTVFFTEGEPVQQVCVVLKGRVELYNQGSRVTIGNGCFLGINDLFMGRCLANCVAVDDIMVYAFSAENMESVNRILGINKDYCGLIMYSAVRYINSLYRARKDFSTRAKESFIWLKSCYQEYQAIAAKSGMTPVKRQGIEQLAMLDEESMLDHKKLTYFLESAAVPLDIMKSFYGYGTGLTVYPLEQAAGVAAELTIECMELADFLEALLLELSGEQQEDGLFFDMVQLTLKLVGKLNMEAYRQHLNGKIDECMDHINILEELLLKKTGRKAIVNRDKIEKLYVALLTGAAPEKNEEEAEVSVDIAKVFADSLSQILNFAEYEEEHAKQFRILIASFEKMPDRTAADDAARQLKHALATLFYDLYEQVFIKAYNRSDISTVVKLFLDFGFVSEKLLEEKELTFLYRCSRSEFTGKHGKCQVFTIREWLTAIFEGRREPSRNELDMDYTDYLRSLKRQGQITEAQEKEQAVDQHMKLHFEINSMFAKNNRMVNGQISSFVPVIYHEMFYQSIDKILLTAEKISVAVEKLKEIDFSVFRREIMLSRPEQGIEKIYIEKEIYPDIILMPTVGTKSSMWQEVAGKRRDSAGRFLLPVFLQEDLELTMVRLFGRYRWELCRFLQGGTWNNIQYHSLTAEYVDYIQFYRKNRELSEEKKEKLKMQIQKSQNNNREVFVIDYEMWIRNEANGALRLTKPAREILATYCPFAKPVRTRLEGQKLFDEAMARYNRNCVKKVREMEQRIRQMTKEQKTDEIPKEILETLDYLKNS